MYPIISIVGRSNSGKTTLLEGVIADLKQRGYKVAVMKHSTEEVELDTVGKDTWRFTRAGSEMSVISSGHNLAVFKRLTDDFGPQELSQFISDDLDLLLTEGFKQSSYPKIEVHRREQGDDLVSPPQQLLAVVTDEPLRVEVPQFPKDEVEKIVDIIVDFMEKTALARHDDIDLLVNDAGIPLDSSSKNLLTRTLVAMVSGLKGISEIKSLRISLRRKT